MMQPPGSAWNTTTSATIQAAMMPLPGFSELQRAASSLIDDVKVQGYDDEQCALLSKRIDRLMRVVRDFGGPQFLDLSELSRELYQIKERFEEENKRPPRFGISGAERRLSVLDNLREEISGLVEESQVRTTCLRMLSRAVRANQAKDEAERLQMVAQGRELRAAKEELECLRRAAKSHDELIAEKNRALQLLIEETQVNQLEINQLEERVEVLKKDNKELLQRWLDHMNEAANKYSEL
ncbi:hypothetical protein FRC06_001946 [Ceratobasidium sp. 370]|nr:hypothetical protein FRC06_001946 [Ceratobasidium sp. 370]